MVTLKTFIQRGKIIESSHETKCLVKNHDYPLLKIARVRAGETDARVIFDITPESRKQFAGFRAVKRKTITRVCKQKPFDI